MSTDASSARPRLRAAIVGAGFAASSHVDALSRVRDVEIAGIVGSSAERSVEAARRFSVDRGYASVDEMLSDPTVDVVHNCTPNDLHARITVAALGAGKHVLSEKPLGIDAAETADLVEHARRADAAGLVTGVCFNYRHYPLVRQVRAELASGTHGPVHLVRGGYLQDWLLFADDWNWRLESARAGKTRAIGDIGSHWLDLVQHVTGDRVVAVMADLGRIHAERLRPAGPVETFTRGGGDAVRVPVDTEDFGSILLRFAGGARGACTISQVSPGAKNRLSFGIDTSTASLEWDQEEPNTLRVGHRDRAAELLPRDASMLGPEAAALAHFPGGHQEGWPDGMRNLFIEFYAAVEARRRGEPADPAPGFATFADAHRITRVVEAIAESDRRRGWVEVED